jgi:uncharacterized protein (TIGR03086 family)
MSPPPAAGLHVQNRREDTAVHDLGPACAAVADLVREVRDDQLGDPTPCERYTVAHLLEHLDGLALAFTLAARKEPVDGTPGQETGDPADGWRTRIPERLADLAAAWRDPDAWTGETAAGGVEMTGDVAGTVAMDEVVVHGWDLARALGRDLAVDGASVAVARDFVSLFSGPGTEEMRGDAFGPERQAPAGASPLEELVALTGRDPSWRA